VFNFTTGQDLCTSSYYTGAVPIACHFPSEYGSPLIPSQIETQIAKQGYRLAAWLNVLFDGSTHLP
jgi:hypothetical protein